MSNNSILKNLVEILSQHILPKTVAGDTIRISDNLLIAFYRAKLSLENPAETMRFSLESPLIMQTCRKCFVNAMSPKDYKDSVCPCCGEPY